MNLTQPTCVTGWVHSPKIGIGQTWRSTMTCRRGHVVLSCSPTLICKPRSDPRLSGLFMTRLSVVLTDLSTGFGPDVVYCPRALNSPAERRFDFRSGQPPPLLGRDVLLEHARATSSKVV